LKVDAATVAGEPLGTGVTVTDAPDGVGEAGVAVAVGVPDGRSVGCGVGVTPQASSATAARGRRASLRFMVS
jgi:hypothetical protein